MENKQTAVEWLVEQIENKNGKEFSSYYSEFLEQAKEMEKGQIIDAYSIGISDEGIKSVYTKANAEEYYNETYGK